MAAAISFAFWCCSLTNAECMPEAVTGMYHLGLKARNFEKTTLPVGCFFCTQHIVRTGSQADAVFAYTPLSVLLHGHMHEYSY